MQESNLDYVLNFQRHEWKYFVPNDVVEGLIPELLLNMKLDKNNKDGQFYPLYSIYYDTEDWQSFYEKIDGIERRKKFRVRTYNKHLDSKSPVFVEVKEKNKDVILKRRMIMNFEDVKRLNLGQKVKNDDPVVDEWRFNIIRNKIKPRILVAYNRLAFEPRDNINLRITLDRGVSYAMVNGGLDFEAPLKDTSFAKTHTVLEIKYKGSPPLFVEQLIRKHNLNNQAISKYAESIISHYKVII